MEVIICSSSPGAKILSSASLSIWVACAGEVVVVTLAGVGWTLLRRGGGDLGFGLVGVGGLGGFSGRCRSCCGLRSGCR